MHTIAAPSSVDGPCPACGTPLELRRQLDYQTFACRYWVTCPRHGVVSDLSSWLDRGLYPDAA